MHAKACKPCAPLLPSAPGLNMVHQLATTVPSLQVCSCTIWYDLGMFIYRFLEPHLPLFHGAPLPSPPGQCTYWGHLGTSRRALLGAGLPTAAFSPPPSSTPCRPAQVLGTTAGCHSGRRPLPRQCPGRGSGEPPQAPPPPASKCRVPPHPCPVPGYPVMSGRSVMMCRGQGVHSYLPVCRNGFAICMAFLWHCCSSFMEGVPALRSLCGKGTTCRTASAIAGVQGRHARGPFLPRLPARTCTVPTPSDDPWLDTRLWPGS